jgi:hypothetical protein
MRYLQGMCSTWIWREMPRGIDGNSRRRPSSVRCRPECHGRVHVLGPSPADRQSRVSWPRGRRSQHRAAPWRSPAGGPVLRPEPGHAHEGRGESGRSMGRRWWPGRPRSSWSMSARVVGSWPTTIGAGILTRLDNPWSDACVRLCQWSGDLPGCARRRRAGSASAALSGVGPLARPEP